MRWQHLREAWLGLARNPVPNLLQCFVFSIALALVLVVVGSVEGGRVQIRGTLYNLGIDIIAVLNPIEIQALNLRLGRGDEEKITDAVLAELEPELDERVTQMLPFELDVCRVQVGEQSETGLTVAIGPGYQKVIRSGLLAGRFLTPDDRRPVEGPRNIVLDEALARTFLPDSPESLVDRVIQVRRGLFRRFEGRVVGIYRDPIFLRKHMRNLDSVSSSRHVSARRLEFMNVYVLYEEEHHAPSGVMVQVENVDDVGALGRELNTFFEARSLNPFFHVQKVWVETFLGIVDRFSKVAYFFTILGFGFLVTISSSVALLMVKSRYLEIAIRRVEGATRGDVILSLALEAVALVGLAIPVGISLFWLGYSLFVFPTLEWNAVVPIDDGLLSGALLIVFALLSYAFPARFVARLNPAVVFSDWVR